MAAWYEKRRALVDFKIFPLPFVPGIVGDKEKNNISCLKCYLEYFNEATKKFSVMKEFEIREGVCTSVIEKKNEQEYGKCYVVS